MSSTIIRKRKFIIDTDAGLDDAQAILMCLARTDIQVVGFTTVTGNAQAKQVTKNLTKLLRVANRLEIPIYCGCDNMLLGWKKPEEYNYHGNDGFGDAPDTDPSDTDNIQEKHGVQALLDLSKENQGELTLLALGPLTNVAMAIRMDTRFGERLKDCYIMGGNYKGQGNISLCGEFNFYSDPEAAYIVLQSLNCPITLACWELCDEKSLSWETYKELRKNSTDTCKFLKEREKLMVANCAVAKWPKYVPCDEIAAACAIDDSVIAESHRVHATVELHGHETRSQMIVDWKNISGRKVNVRIVTDIDMEKYMNLLASATSDR